MGLPIVSLFLLQRIDPHRPSYPSSDAKRFGIGLPDLEQRANILIKLVSTFEVSIPDILKLKSKTLNPPISSETLAGHAEGLSGSDLRELCRNAAMVPVRELMR